MHIQNQVMSTLSGGSVETHGHLVVKWCLQLGNGQVESEASNKTKAVCSAGACAISY